MKYFYAVTGIIALSTGTMYDIPAMCAANARTGNELGLYHQVGDSGRYLEFNFDVGAFVLPSPEGDDLFDVQSLVATSISLLSNQISEGKVPGSSEFEAERLERLLDEEAAFTITRLMFYTKSIIGSSIIGGADILARDNFLKRFGLAGDVGKLPQSVVIDVLMIAPDSELVQRVNSGFMTNSELRSRVLNLVRDAMVSAPQWGDN